MTVERLYLAELPLHSTPQYARAVDGARGKAAGVASPANVNDVSHVASELPRVAPLHSLLGLAKLRWQKLQRPNYHHLVVRARRQVLTTRRESHHVHRRSVPALEVVPIVRDPPGLVGLWALLTNELPKL